HFASDISYIDGNVGIGTSTPTARLHVNGEVKVDGANALELGADVIGKEPNAGKLGYQLFTPDALDIVGAGTGANRTVKFWAEGGTSFNGGATITGNVGIGTATPMAALHVDGEIKVNGANALELGADVAG